MGTINATKLSREIILSSNRFHPAKSCLNRLHMTKITIKITNVTNLKESLLIVNASDESKIHYFWDTRL